MDVHIIQILSGYLILRKQGFLHIFPRGIYHDGLICFRLLIFDIEFAKTIKVM